MERVEDREDKKLDREERRDAQEDAERRLFNRLRFGAELGFPIMPVIYGGGKIAKMISSKGKELAYSNSRLARWVDRWIAQPFRSRSKYPRELAKEMRGVEGKESSDWKLIDGKDIIVHIFNPEKRKVYQLERMWSELIPEERIII